MNKRLYWGAVGWTWFWLALEMLFLTLHQHLLWEICGVVTIPGIILMWAAVFKSPRRR